MSLLGNGPPGKNHRSWTTRQHSGSRRHPSRSPRPDVARSPSHHPRHLAASRTNPQLHGQHRGPHPRYPHGRWRRPRGRHRCPRPRRIRHVAHDDSSRRRRHWCPRHHLTRRRSTQTRGSPPRTRARNPRRPLHGAPLRAHHPPLPSPHHSEIQSLKRRRRTRLRLPLHPRLVLPFPRNFLRLHQCPARHWRHPYPILHHALHQCL